ncbi:MAG TPA: carboxypeptidase M32 [Rhabdochlamydiaceae bacterium]|nr:carboxypeptidase M32 [Rhabdochlamydiaceae bacterium]
MGKKVKDSYNQLHELSKTSSLLTSVTMVLGWDQETYMPHQAIEFRSQQLEYLASLIHKEKTSAKFSKMLSKLIDLETGAIKDDKLSASQKAALKEWRRDYLNTVKLPSSFVKKMSKASSMGTHIWMQAKENNNFAFFLPQLEKIVDLTRKKADLLGYKDHPYDALIDTFEPETTTAQITDLFSNLKIVLKNLLEKIMQQPPVSESFLYLNYPPAKQLHFVHELLKTMGFDKSFSRLDQSAHPMCIGIHPTDTRMTTRVHPNKIMMNIFSVVHEGGHGLYHHGLPKDQFGTPLSEPISYGIDESQSRIWETIIGRSLPFWNHFYPILQKEFPENLASVHLDEFYRAINSVKPSLIRTDADEVTYNLHIIIRFELEKALVDGSLKAKDLPEAWNEKMRQYLGIVPSNVSEGCLQDIHWSMGAIGYFPTYTLGNLYSAQFFETFVRKHPAWDEKVSKGDFSELRTFLYENIHRFGREYTAGEIVKKVTGKPLSEKPFLDYLEKKYKAIYHFA